MQILKKIKLGNNNYYIIVDVEYKKEENNIPRLCIKNAKDDYWDGGDCSILIEKLEKGYSSEKAKKYYDKYIGFMADILYIYDRIPFISGIKDVYISNADNVPYSIGYISKEEIENYIRKFHIKMNDNHDFRLYDTKTWKL